MRTTLQRVILLDRIKLLFQAAVSGVITANYDAPITPDNTMSYLFLPVKAVIFFTHFGQEQPYLFMRNLINSKNA